MGYSKSMLHWREGRGTGVNEKAAKSDMELRTWNKKDDVTHSNFFCIHLTCTSIFSSLVTDAVLITCTSWSVVKCTNVVNLVWRLYNEKNFAFSLIFPCFSPSNKSGVITDSGFNVYFWRLLIFRWTLYKADISIKGILFPCTNGVQFTEIPCHFLKYTLSSTKDTSTHY